MLEKTVASLAILKVNADHGKDYIGNFVPFVAECVRMSPDEVVSLDYLRENIEREFGLRIPSGPLRTILRRAAKEQVVTARHSVYYRNEEKVDYNFPVERERYGRRHETLVSRLIEFVGAHYETTWTREEADAALLAYLAKNSVAVISTAVQGKRAVESPISAVPAAVRDGDYLVNAFVDHLHHADQEGFEFLETVVKGRMLADALFLFEDLNQVAGRRFNNVEVYLDTPFLIRAMGCSGKSMEAPCSELINLLTENYAKLCVFEHTYTETEAILDRCARVLRDPTSVPSRRGESLQYFIDEGLSAGDIEAIIDHMPRQLDSLNIHVKPVPRVTTALSVDEMKLRQTLLDDVGYREKEGTALDRDVASLTAVFRLRNGQMQLMLETCGALFVTTNANLAAASERFFREEYGHTRVPVCTLDYVLATYIWLKEPLRASSDLPRKQIIANCYAAMNPEENFWHKFLDRVERLRREGKVSELDLQLAKSSPRILMQVTRGNEEAFTEGTVAQVLAIARAAIAEEERQKLEAENASRIEQLEREHRERIQQHEDRHQETEQRLQEEARRRAQYEEQVTSDTARRRAVLAGIDATATRIGVGFKWALFVVLLLLLVASCGLAVPLPARFTPVWETRYKGPAYAVLLIGLALTSYCTATGESIRTLDEKLERWLVRFIRSVILAVRRPEPMPELQENVSAPETAAPENTEPGQQADKG